MSPTDRRNESHSEAGFSGREGEAVFTRDGGSSKHSGNGLYKRERGDWQQDSDRDRKKSKSRSPWEERGRGQGHSDPDLYGWDGPEGRSGEPSKKERMEKRTRSEPPLREAGEISDERPRVSHRDSKRGRADERHRSRHSKDATGLPPTGRKGDASPGRSERQRGRDRGERGVGQGEQRARSKTPLRLTGIPAEIRQAALEAQKREQARLAAAAASRADEDGEGQVISSGSAQSKHTPIIWNGGGKGEGRKSPRQIAGTAAELAALELEEFKRSQQVTGIDPDAPAAMKASPSVTQSDDGEAPGAEAMEVDSGSAEAAPAGIKSRWLIDEEEAEPPAVAPTANGAEAADAAEAAVLEELERQEGEGAGEEWESEEEEKSEFQMTRREICMMNACRKVECYERLNRISEGTYGVVYRARDRETGTICALKRIKMEREREGFPLTSIREINILLSFQHPNIVDVSEVVVGDSLDQIYMVMEFMEHDLKGLMDDMTEPFTVAETKNLMQQLLEGMAYLHSNWVLHRDLKTSNILYNNRGQLKICDFGLARQYGSPLRPYTHNVVTLYYRAIELLLGCEKYSTAIDVWSLGCIMAELLTKRVLFDGNGELGQIDKIFKVLGTPTEQTWPGYRKLPNVTKLKLVNQPRTLRSVLPAASKFDPNSGLTEAGFDLIERMLSLDPACRISAKDALEHTWFKEQPWPKDNALMPTYPTNKDGSSKASRQRVQRPPPPSELAAGPNFASRRNEIGLLFGKK